MRRCRFGGNEAVVAYLMQRDISKFDPKAPPPKTAAFWSIVDANRPSEESELSDILDTMNLPKGFTMKALQDQANYIKQYDLANWLQDRKNRRQIPHRLEKCGYVPIRNPKATDGLWKHNGRRQVIYVKSQLSLREQLEAVNTMVDRKADRYGQAGQ